MRLERDLYEKRSFFAFCVSKQVSFSMHNKRMDKSTNETNSLRLGYARASTDDQDMALQLDALAKMQCDRGFSEKVSSGKASRPQLEECLRTLPRGDLLTQCPLNH